MASVRVLDLSRILAGPLAAQVLADLGADVVKVERPDVGDETRRWGPPFHGPDAAYFYALNRNRRAIELDLASDGGQQVLRWLVPAADIVVENFLPHQYADLGLAELRAASPSTVWLSIRGAANGGPLGGLPGFDAMVQARSGVMSVTGFESGSPIKVGVPIADIVTGLYAAHAGLAAVIAHRQHPEQPAATIEVPLLECAVACLTNQAANYLIGGSVPTPFGNDHPNIAPYGPLPTADRQLMIGAGTDAQYRALCVAIDRPELSADPRFATNADRVAHRDHLKSELSRTLSTRPASKWIQALTEAGVPHAPINRIDEALHDPQLVADGMLQDIATRHGTVTLLGCPLTINGTRPPIRRPPPGLGEHNAELLGASPRAPGLPAEEPR